MRVIRVGIIGAGMMGIQHAEAIRRVPGVEIIALADSNGAAAEIAGEKPEITLQPGETVDYRWISPEDFPTFVAQDMIPSQRRRYHDFLAEKGYL